MKMQDHETLKDLLSVRVLTYEELCVLPRDAVVYVELRYTLGVKRNGEPRWTKYFKRMVADGNGYLKSSWATIKIAPDMFSNPCGMPDKVKPQLRVWTSDLGKLESKNTPWEAKP